MKGRRIVNARSTHAVATRCVFGVHPVAEQLHRRARDVVEVSLTAGDEKREVIARHATQSGIRVSYATREALTAMCGSSHHQGIVATLRDFEYASLERVVAARPPLLVAADGVEDPRNLGALVRGVAAAGAGAVVIPRDRAAGVTAVVEKSSAGVTAWYPLCRVTNVARTLAEVKKDPGYWVIGLSQHAKHSIYAFDPPQLMLLVVGGETGLRPLVEKACDVLLRIPMCQGVESLNVAVAAAVAAFELRRRHIDRYGGGW